MAEVFQPCEEGDLPNLSPLNGALTESTTTKEKASVALKLLRQAAIASRESKGRPFYSIRAVAKHFSLPPTTVVRLYGQLKTEGVLGSIWGSKTIIEPSQLDNEIRLKAIVLLPVPLRAFSVLSTYRSFVRHMQRALWKQRFGSQIAFYDEGLFEGCRVTETLLENTADVVVWLLPPPRMSTCLARLTDRGIKSVVIRDEMPLNGEAGYYLSWQDAVIECLTAWKQAGHRKAVVIRDAQSNCCASLRLLQSCLRQVGIASEVNEASAFRTHHSSAEDNAAHSGVIFLSAVSLIQFAQAGIDGLQDLVRHNRVLFIHGGVDLPFQTPISCSFDTVGFDWRMISRRLVRKLAAGCTNHIDHQAIFKARWHTASNRK